MNVDGDDIDSVIMRVARVFGWPINYERHYYGVSISLGGGQELHVGSQEGASPSMLILAAAHAEHAAWKANVFPVCSLFSYTGVISFCRGKDGLPVAEFEFGGSPSSRAEATLRAIDAVFRQKKAKMSEEIE